MDEHKQRKKASTLTPENLEESRRLRAIWVNKGVELTQAEFGDRFDIGGQGMVWQCLNGKQTAISLKAAVGFANGLGCAIEDFSPRLASLALDYAAKATKHPVWPFRTIDRETFYAMDPHWHGIAEERVQDVIKRWSDSGNKNGTHQ